MSYGPNALRRVAPEVTKERLDALKATERVWHKRYVVLLPKYATLTPSQLKMYGTAYNSGYTREERELDDKEMTSMRMSTNRMIGLYEEGIPMAFPNRMQAVAIYMDIKQHIQNWNDITGKSLNNVSDAPDVADFELMLEFAENLECYLEYYYSKITAASFSAFRKTTMNRFVNTDTYVNRQDSTYSKLREGVYGFASERKPRIESTRRAPVDHGISGHYQKQASLDASDFDSINSQIRG